MTQLNIEESQMKPKQSLNSQAGNIINTWTEFAPHDPTNVYSFYCDVGRNPSQNVFFDTAQTKIKKKLNGVSMNVGETRTVKIKSWKLWRPIPMTHEVTVKMKQNGKLEVTEIKSKNKKRHAMQTLAIFGGVMAIPGAPAFLAGAAVLGVVVGICVGLFLFASGVNPFVGGGDDRQHR